MTILYRCNKKGCTQPSKASLCSLRLLKPELLRFPFTTESEQCQIGNVSGGRYTQLFPRGPIGVLLGYLRASWGHPGTFLVSSCAFLGFS